MTDRKIAVIIFSVLLTFFGAIPVFAVGDLTILYTGDTYGKIKPIEH